MRLFSLLDSPFRPEPPFTHGQPPATPNRSDTAVLFCNLGTPDDPTPAAVRRYLREFLSDHRVIEIPKVIWNLVLHGIILRTRPKQSAAKYASIWTKEGSPLRLWTQKQALLLQGWLGERGHRVTVRYAMRYGNPSIAVQLDQLKAEGVNRVLVVPAYPQYSATSTASVFDAVYTWASRTRHIPELRFVNRYHDDPGYIDALAGNVRQHWKHHGRPDKLVMSFHGVPERTLHLGDPYHCECHKTARLLAEALGLQRSDYQVTFQSRLGRAKWLEPYTEPSLIALGRAGVQRVDVFCPGFTSDCLETLEEIAMEGRAAFLTAGGKEFHHIPCVNDQPAFISALGEIALAHLGGWPTQRPLDPVAMAASKAHAMALGAKA
ncbi:MAG: ferrochelatase [Rhodoferax sp.]|nr:ferrochelatase [Rhodoferax sp.]